VTLSTNTVSTRFVSTFADDGCYVELVENGEGISPQRWTEAATGYELAQASHLLVLAGDGKGIVSDAAIFLPNATIASLSDGQVRSLNLPPVAPFVLEIRAHGVMADAEFSLDTRWYRQDGRPIPVAAPRGAELNVSGERYVVLDPLYTILERIRMFNADPPRSLDAKMAFWGDLRSLTGGGQDQGCVIRPDRYLDNMRVYRATRFTLDLKTAADGTIDFDPVPLASAPMQRRLDIETGDERPDEPATLLPPALDDTFARRFRSHEGVLPQYAIEGGTYVVFSDEVHAALETVRKTQQASPAERKRFARNPQAFIRADLVERGLLAPESGSSGDVTTMGIDDLFIETSQFSDRVQELGLWQRPTLPWVVATSHGWLPPETTPVGIGGREYEIHVEDLPELVEQVDEAMNAKCEVVPYHGDEIPATGEARTALQAAQDRIQDEADVWLEERAVPEKPEARKGPFSFKGGENDNFEIAGYAAKLTPRAHGGVDLPLLTMSLLPHQEQGIAWLQARWQAGFRGALLADDMGLGKTLQCLAFLAWIRRQMFDGKQPRRPFLIVAPTGLIDNWLAEHEKHLAPPGLGRAVVARGALLDRYRHAGRVKDVSTGREALRTRELGAEDWILTTYETLRDYQYSFGAIHFAAVVFDEAQKIKNPGALATNVAKHMNADFFLACTGTPVENRLADLWSLADTIEPAYLGPLRAFSHTYEDVEVDQAERAVRLGQLRKRIEAVPGRPPPGMMLRRMKDDHLPDLPAKSAQVVTRTMPPAQAAAYDEAVRGSRSARASHREVLTAIQRLRSISLHHAVQGSMNDEDYIAGSARFVALFALLDSIKAADEKALVFVESLDLQPYLAALIQRRYDLAGLPMTINGGVPGPKRLERVDIFQEQTGFDVMILTPRAGGVGLTLHKANHVIHLSRWWNPAVEDQCTDRVYRIGQSKPVHVYYLQAIHPVHGEQSFDAKLHGLLEHKRALSHDLLIDTSKPEADAAQLYAETISEVST
jgi:hypothetical protein